MHLIVLHLYNLSCISIRKRYALNSSVVIGLDENGVTRPSKDTDRCCSIISVTPSEYCGAQGNMSSIHPAWRHSCILLCFDIWCSLDLYRVHRMHIELAVAFYYNSSFPLRWSSLSSPAILSFPAKSLSNGTPRSLAHAFIKASPSFSMISFCPFSFISLALA